MPPDDPTAPRPCPRCDRPLDDHLVGDVPVARCGACDGLWVDPIAFEQLVEAAAPGEPAAPPPAAARPVTYVKCPDCAARMNRQNFGRRSGVIVDLCKAHGLWFDPGELPAVLAFVRAGGLEETARRELEEMRERLRRQRFDAAVARGLSAPRPGMGPPG